MNSHRATILTCIVLVFVFLILFPLLSYGQELRLMPSNGESGPYLNEQIAADIAQNGQLPIRVYVLQRGALYLVNAVITSTNNYTLRLKANDSTSTYNYWCW